MVEFSANISDISFIYCMWRIYFSNMDSDASECLFICWCKNLSGLFSFCNTKNVVGFFVVVAVQTGFVSFKGFLKLCICFLFFCLTFYNLYSFIPKKKKGKKKHIKQFKDVWQFFKFFLCSSIFVPSSVPTKLLEIN